MIFVPDACSLASECIYELMHNVGAAAQIYLDLQARFQAFLALDIP